MPVNDPRTKAAQPKPRKTDSLGLEAVAGRNKQFAVDVGDRVYDVSHKLGTAAAPYIAGRANDGFIAGLGQGLQSADSLSSLSFEPDADFFKFPSTAPSLKGG